MLFRIYIRIVLFTVPALNILYFALDLLWDWGLPGDYNIFRELLKNSIIALFFSSFYLLAFDKIKLELKSDRTIFEKNLKQLLSGNNFIKVKGKKNCSGYNSREKKKRSIISGQFYSSELFVCCKGSHCKIYIKSGLKRNLSEMIVTAIKNGDLDAAM